MFLFPALRKLFMATAAVTMGAALAQAGDTTSQQAQASQAQAAQPGGERSVSDWLMRMHEASRRRTYVGTFVVSAGSGNLSSARIWHACDGVQQMERVESLTGTPRSTFRRNDQVVTFLPDSKVVRSERRESLGLFPNLLKSSDSAIAEFYTAQKVGQERVAGFEADVVQLTPRDGLRFGYRVWSERKSGLVVKLQTLAADGSVLEQAAFSELQMDAPVKMDKLARMMASTEGYKVERADPVKTSAQAEGWVLRNPVAGFKPMNCYKRTMPAGAAAPEGTVQWIFSDGLASVSVFAEPFDRQRHLQEAALGLGATQTLTHRLGDKGGDWWLTVVGEAPPQTLKAFAQSIERRK